MALDYEFKYLKGNYEASICSRPCGYYMACNFPSGFARVPDDSSSHGKRASTAEGIRFDLGGCAAGGLPGCSSFDEALRPHQKLNSNRNAFVSAKHKT